MYDGFVDGNEVEAAIDIEAAIEVTLVVANVFETIKVEVEQYLELSYPNRTTNRTRYHLYIRSC